MGNSLQIAFLIIITLGGVGYAFWTKQLRMAAGLFVLAVAFVLQIPNLVFGFWVDIFTAFSIILFALGIFIIAWKKKEEQLITEKEENKIEESK